MAEKTLINLRPEWTIISAGINILLFKNLYNSGSSGYRIKPDKNPTDRSTSERPLCTHQHIMNKIKSSTLKFNLGKL